MHTSTWEQSTMEYGLAGIGSVFALLGMVAAVEPAGWVINVIALMAGLAAIGMRIWDRFKAKETRDELVAVLRQEVEFKDQRIDELETDIKGLMERLLESHK